MSAVPEDIKRLREHAKAAITASQTKAALIAADARESALSVGEHPDALASAAEDTDNAYQAHKAALFVLDAAYRAYTNPFGVEKTTGMG